MNNLMQTAVVAAATFGLVQTAQAQSGSGGDPSKVETKTMHNNEAKKSLFVVKETHADGTTHEVTRMLDNTGETVETVDATTNGQAVVVKTSEAGPTLHGSNHDDRAVTTMTLTADQFAAAKANMLATFKTGEKHINFSPSAQAPSL